MNSKPPKVAIDDRINDELRRLQKVVAILACVTVAAEYSEERIDLGDAVGVALKLVRESLKKLDQITMQIA